MAIAFVKEATPAVGSSVTTLTVSFASNVGTGNACFAQVTILNGTTALPATVSGAGASTSWFSYTSIVPSSTLCGGSLHGGTAAGTAGSSVTVTFSAAATYGVDAVEFSGLNTLSSGSDDSGGAKHNQTSGATVAPGSQTSLNANDVWIGHAGNAGSVNNTDPGSPWVALTNFGSSALRQSGVYQIVSATGSFNPSFTVGTSGNTSVALADSFAGPNPAIPLTPSRLPLQAVRGNDPWQAAPQMLRQHNVVFRAANLPDPYQHPPKPIPAWQAGMQQWWAPVPALHPTITEFHGATDQDWHPVGFPFQAIGQPWWAPVWALHPTITEFHGATERDFRPTGFPYPAIQQGWQLQYVRIPPYGPNDIGIVAISINTPTGFPFAAIQRGAVMAPVASISGHTSSAGPVVGADPIVVWRHRAGMQ